MHSLKNKQNVTPSAPRSSHLLPQIHSLPPSPCAVPWEAGPLASSFRWAENGQDTGSLEGGGWGQAINFPAGSFPAGLLCVTWHLNDLRPRLLAEGAHTGLFPGSGSCSPHPPSLSSRKYTQASGALPSAHTVGGNPFITSSLNHPKYTLAFPAGPHFTTRHYMPLVCGLSVAQLDHDVRGGNGFTLCRIPTCGSAPARRK